MINKTSWYVRSLKKCVYIYEIKCFLNHNIRKMKDIFINWKPNVEINVLFEVLKLLVPENVIFLPLGHFLIVLFFYFSESPTSIAYRKKYETIIIINISMYFNYCMITYFLYFLMKLTKWRQQWLKGRAGLNKSQQGSSSQEICLTFSIVGL